MATKTVSRDGAGLRWYQGLQFKLALIFALLLTVLAAGALWASRTLVQGSLADERFRYEQESGLRLFANLRITLNDAQSLAANLAQLALEPGISLDTLASAAPRLAKDRPSTPLIAAIGVWPEPNSLAPSRERASLVWMRDASGTLRSREDYNDPRTVPYYREAWYTPTRYTREDRGYWTGVRQEPLLKRDVITVAMPIKDGRGFLGVATVSLSLAALTEHFASLDQNESGYSLLFDNEARLLALSKRASSALGEASQAGHNLAELAKSNNQYQPLAVSVHKRDESLRSSMLKSARYDAKQVSALKDGTRNLSRQQAEDVLSGIWQSLNGADDGQQAPGRVEIETDPVLGESSYATLFELPMPAWKLVRFTPTKDGLSGASYLVQQSLVVSLGLLLLTLVLIFIVLRSLVISPLKRMAQALEGSRTAEETQHVVLDESARNEVGVLAHWLNERVRQLREAMDLASTSKSQLVSESGDRRLAQDQLARAQERATLALQSVSDGVITTDDQGAVEDMNPVAESLIGLTLREARGKPLTEVLRARTQEQPDSTPNLALLAMERGTRQDYTEGLSMEPFGAAPREIVLRASPMRLRGRMVGAVLAFHERRRRDGSGQDESASPSPVERMQRDLLTGLQTRAACERRLNSLLEQARSSKLTHALLYLDVDHLKRINDVGGQPAGDDVLVRVGETLATAAPVATDVYRLAADQFAVILESVDETSALAVAERLREQLGSTRFYWESRYFSVTASVGLSCFDGKSSSALDIIRQGDDACAAAKRAGRNCVLAYDARMDRLGRTIDDQAWVRCIRRGLDENLFHLRTQWIMAGKDYATEGNAYEVLLALEDEEGFWAAPAAFMPVAERHHLTATIDRWVIQQTLMTLDAQPALAESLAFCSINLSVQTLSDHTFIDFVAGQLENRPGLAGKLCFELREQALADHPQEAALCCEVLHKMGCKLSIDHYFGRQMSDLMQLRKLPIDFVKMDAQAFKSLATDAVEQMMAESTLRIVRHMRRRVIVYNVDDAKAVETWRKFGADYFQGYAFAKPSPVVFLAPD